MSAEELLKTHLGPAQMEDAINHLAQMIDDGELLAATDPVKFLHLAAEKLERLEKIVTKRNLERNLVHRANDEVEFLLDFTKNLSEAGSYIDHSYEEELRKHIKTIRKQLDGIKEIID